MSYPRGTFHQRYASPKNTDHWRPTTHRLLDLMVCVEPLGAPAYLEEPEPGEFVVVDTWTKEKAWFELPDDCGPAVLCSMIASSFNAAPVRISEKVWCV